jgi:hypothetical protein
MAKTTTGFPDDEWRRTNDALRRLTGAGQIQKAMEGITGASQIQDAMNRIGGTEEIRRLADQMSSANALGKLNAPAMQLTGMPTAKAISQIADTLSPMHDWQRIMDQTTAAGKFQSIAAQVTANWRPDILRPISQQLRNVSAASFSSDKWTEVFEAMESFQEMAAAAAQAEPAPEPQGEEEATVGWWLAALSPRTQIALLVLGLDALDKMTGLLAAATGQKIPEPLQPATQFCLAMVAFLLMWLDLRDPELDDGNDQD